MFCVEMQCAAASRFMPSGYSSELNRADSKSKRSSACLCVSVVKNRSTICPAM